MNASRNLNLPLHPVQNNFLQLQKEGTLAGYDFIGWLKKTGELVKDACPQNRHTPIYWKMPETGKWFSFSSAALREAVVKDAILSVKDRKWTQHHRCFTSGQRRHESELANRSWPVICFRLLSQQ